MFAMIALHAAIVRVLLLGALLVAAGDGQPQKLSLPPLWSFSPALSFPSSGAASLNSYAELAPFSLFVPILSSTAFSTGSKGFSFGFLSLFEMSSLPPSQISLCICLGVQASADGRPFLLPVWNLNTSIPLQQASQGGAMSENRALVRLQVDAEKQLSLLVGDGTPLWIVGGVGSMELQSNGNLVIYGDGVNASAVWQSFDHPSDTLVPGQRLRMGMQLTSKIGMYKVMMEAGGLVYYLVSDNPVPLVYRIYSANNTVNQYFGDMAGMLSLDRNASINLTAAMHSPVCRMTTNASSAYFALTEDAFYVRDTCGSTLTILLNYTVDFVRLDDDGETRLYSVQELPNSSYAVTFKQSEQRPCFSPNACGPYGICYTTTLGTAVQRYCRCPAQEDNLGDEFYSWPYPAQEYNVVNLGCTRVVELNCEQASFQVLAEIEKVAYMSMLPLYEVMWKENTKSLEDCKALCAASCSCSGLIYHRKSSFCLPFGDNTTLSSVSFVSVPSDEHIAYVKLQLFSYEFISKPKSHKIAIAVTVPIIIVSAAVSFIYWKCQKHKDHATKLAEQQLLDVLPMLPKRYTYRELKKFTQGFNNRLGSGGFGSVFEGLLPDGRRVAVKNLDFLSQGQKEFLAEIATIGGISHVNIVNLYGFCLERHHRLLVYEYMENGSLDKWLFSKRGQDLPTMRWETRFNVAVGTARGLAYLHEECPKPILHFDVKPQNILLDVNLGAKLADFGLAKLVARDESSVMTVVRGTPGYIAPEWVFKLIVSKKCDVYSFGMVLLELVSGRKIVEMELMESEQWYLPKWAAKKSRLGEFADLLDIRLLAGAAASESQRNTEIDAGAEAGYQDAILEQVKAVVRVALLCIHENPERRPIMTTVCGMLEGSIPIPDDIPTVDVSVITEYNGTLPGSVEVLTQSSIQGR